MFLFCVCVFAGVCLCVLIARAVQYKIRTKYSVKANNVVFRVFDSCVSKQTQIHSISIVSQSCLDIPLLLVSSLFRSWSQHKKKHFCISPTISQLLQRPGIIKNTRHERHEITNKQNEEEAVCTFTGYMKENNYKNVQNGVADWSLFVTRWRSDKEIDRSIGEMCFPVCMYVCLCHVCV